MFAGSKQDLDLRCRQTLMTNAYFFNLILIKLTYKLMRRFTLFLALCLMCIGGTALAQVITAVGNPIAPSEISPSKKYVIYAKGQGFVNVDANNYNGANKTSLVAFVGATKNPYIYTFEGNSTDGWKIKNSNGNYLPGFTNGAAGRFANVNINSSGVFSIEAVAEGTNTENTLNNGSNMVTIKNSAEGGLYVVWNSGNGCLGVNAYNGGTAPNTQTGTSAVWGTTSFPFQICEATTSEYTAAAITELSPRITSTEDLKVGYQYLIRNVGNSDRRGYVYEENGELKVTLGDAFYNATPADKLSDACIFTVTGNGTEGFAFVGKSGNTYKAGSKLKAKPGKEAGVWNVKTTDSYLNLNAGSVVEWNQEGDANGVWEFYPINVGTENLVNITYNIKQDGTTISSSTVQNAIVGFGYPNIQLPQTASSYYTLTGQPTSPITAENTTIDLTYTENLPFATSNSYANAHWCYLTIDQGKYMLTDNGNASYISLNSTKLNVNNYDANLWCFVGNAFEGFKIYNKAAGPNKVLSSSTTMGQNTGANTYPVLTSTSELNGKNERWAVTVGNNLNNNTGFFLSQQGYPQNKMNRRDNKLAYWNAGADNGSTFLVAAESAEAARTNLGTPYSVGVNVGQVSQETANSHTIAGYEALTTGQAVANFFVEINAAKIMPEESKYYRIINKERKTNEKLDMLSIKADGIHSQGQASTNANVDMLWKFVVCEDGYKIKRANADQYLGVLANRGEQSLYDYTNGAKFTIELLEDGYVRLKDGNGSVMHDDGSHKLCAWSNGDASVWQIVPATDIEVALNTVGDASYATVYLPFAVQVPGDGVTKLYTGEIDGNQLNMTAQDGVVPAETGYVLCNTSAAASTTLTISSETSSISGTNNLQGTLTGITFGDNRSSYLVLGQSKTNGTIGFYTPSGNLAAIGKNKAYLNASSVGTQANAIALNFDDVTTGISLTEVNGENAPVYDLSGRRVQRTVKGGLYIQNGKKYIVK